VLLVGFCGAVEEIEAAGIGLDDAEAAPGGLVLLL